MSFLKKQSIGFYLTILTVILAVVGISAYFINCNTAYFINFGVDSRIVSFGIIAIILHILFILGSEIMGSRKILDILPVASTILLVITLVLFISSRTNSIAAIMTFDKNDQTMADLSSALIGIGVYVIAVAFSILSSFFRVVKD